MVERDKVDSLHQRRFAANQTVFRRANERLSQYLGASASESVEYVCECGDNSCDDLITLLTSEYEHVRSNSAWFVIALDHEILAGDAERILETHRHHHVVEKSGAAAVTAVATDNRHNRAPL